MRRTEICASSLLLIVLGCITSLGAAHNSGPQKSSQPSAVRDTSSLNANRIYALLNNRGSLDYYGQPAGAFWLSQQQGSLIRDEILFDAGIGLIGKFGDTLRLGFTQWGSSYAPGPVIDGKPALWVRPQDSTRYRPYKITKGDNATTNPDYAEWPGDLGAPTDPQGRPGLYGDQTIWMVYNNADTSVRPYEWTRTGPFPHAALEIHQLAYSHQSTYCDSAALLANVIFFEWTIINKESLTIDSAYAILWTDIDFNGADSNVPAIDTLLQLPYCWDAPAPWHPTPGQMAVGYLPLHGPVVPSLGDTAIFRGLRRLGYKNLPISSFWPILDDAGYDTGTSFLPARTLSPLWNIARGFYSNGTVIRDPQTSQATRFPYAGDPVTGTGWIWQDGLGGGSGFYVFWGPFTMAPNDTQWLQAALVPARGRDNLDAIQILREHARTLRGMSYDDLLNAEFEHIPCAEPYVPTSTRLFQNYPNPFNAGTKIAYEVEQPTHVRLTVFDLLGKEVAVLVEGPQNTGRHSVDFTGKGLASGVYFYQLRTTTSSMTRKLVILR